MLRKLQDFNRDIPQNDENIFKFKKLLEDEAALLDYLAEWLESYQEFDSSDAHDWKVLEDSNPFIKSQDYCEYNNAIEEADGLWNNTDKGYDGYMMRGIWEAVSDLCDKIWLFGDGENKFYNCLLDAINRMASYERTDNFENCVFVIRSLPFLRAQAGFHMLKMGLL